MDAGRTIEANGLEVFYRERGDGPALILLHGATDTHKLWDPFLPHLAGEFRVIRLDSRGHGKTPMGNDGLSYQLMADDLAGFISALNLDRPCLLGYSDGGQVVLDFGIRYPGLAGALIMGGVWFQFSRPYQEAISRAGFISHGVVDYEVYQRQAPQDWMERMARAHPRKDPEYPRMLLDALAAMWWKPLNYSREDLEGIREPCLILVGERDEMIPLAEAVELAGSIPGAQLQVIREATHNEVLEDPEMITSLVKDFLARVDYPR